MSAEKETKSPVKEATSPLKAAASPAKNGKTENAETTPVKPA